MALNAADVRASILKYLETNFISAYVAWPGRDWDTSTWNAWIEPHVTWLTESDPRRSGYEIIGSININVFRRLAEVDTSTDNAYTASWIGSVLETLFSHRNVPVRDYVTGSGATTLGVASFGRATVIVMGIKDSLDQVSLGAPFMAS